MPGRESSATQDRPEIEAMIEARLNAAREDGWYAYGDEAQADMEWLLSELRRVREHNAGLTRQLDNFIAASKAVG